MNSLAGTVGRGHTARQGHGELCVLTGLAFHIEVPLMLLYHNVKAQRQPKPRPFARWFGCEKRLEDFIFYFGGDSGAVVFDYYFYP